MEVGYGIAWAGTLRATPYVGFRYMDAPAPPMPKLRLGAASLGLRLNGMASDRIGYQLGAGVDYYAFSAASPYAGASAISGLEAFALPGAALAHRASPVGSAAIFYQIDRTQRLTGDLYLRSQAFSSQMAATIVAGYQVAF